MGLSGGSSGSVGGGRVVGVVEDSRFGGIDLSPWGKFDRGVLAVYPLLFHMLDAAAIAGELWDRFLTPRQRQLIADGLGVTLGQARCLVAFFAGLHDLGKLSWFQEQEAHPWARVSEDLRADRRGWQRMPHERASMHTALHLLIELGYDGQASDSPAVRVAQILGGHHGRFLQVDVDGAASAARVETALGGPRWQDLRRRYLALVRRLTQATSVPTRVSVPAAVLITGVGVVADRLASQRHYWLPKAQAPAFGAGEHYAQAVKDAAEAVDRSGLARVTLPAVPFAQAHAGLEAPNELQASLIEQLTAAVGKKGAGIVVVTDATGGGKTVMALEAARIFNAACGTAGVGWLLPTTATADAAYEILEAYVSAHGPDRAPVTLVHSHSFLNTAYADPQLRGQELSTCDAYWPGDDQPDAQGRPAERVTVPDGWLRGWDRALLAQFTVTTHDQALMAALPVRFNALRLMALSGRTVIVDEAHALTPFMQQPLKTLLHWLGAFGTPVVLLSATMPASTSSDLVRSYLSGAGHRRDALAARSFAPAYPGWLFAAAADATTVTMDQAAGAAHAAKHRRDAVIRQYDVRHPSHTDPDDATPREDRLSHVAAELTQVIHGGGCAAVACATVSDAQDTYHYLRTELNWPGGVGEDLVLLHARLPGMQREALTRSIRTQLGPNGPRPERLIVVTTSLLDMSLNVDVDVLISDLASLARLLQRLGRLWRFETLWGPDSGRRPAWARKQGARLSVLHPTDHRGNTLLPLAWRTLEPGFLTHATAAHLAQASEHPVTLPDDVQHLVESVHGDAVDLTDAPADRQRRHTAHTSRRRAEEHFSAQHIIPAARHVASLADLHRQRLHASEAATRLGAMPRRLLPCYRTPDGTLTLDARGTQPLPLDRELTTRQTRTILRHTLPVPVAWVADRRSEHRTPAAWKRHPLLADLVLLPQNPGDPTEGVRFGRHILRLDGDLGLVHREQ
ncbi:CRISPR-associated helicase Cas3' [Streptomyces bluensis]|uniref:CRISPR-associated helicase Cas3 n=1 Tax=Streptomyces bluensis TaxID=33897 RepID=A0ABW6UZL3_9ACTN